MSGPIKLHWGLIVALVALAVFWFLMERSTLGFQIRAVGANAAAARTAGISVARITAVTMMFSGAFLGLAGANEALGTLGYVSRDVAGSIGFDAITVALLGRNKAWGTFGAGLLFGAFKAGGYAMQAKDVPIDMILILQAVIVLLIAAPALVRWLFRLPDAKRLAASGKGKRRFWPSAPGSFLAPTWPPASWRWFSASQHTVTSRSDSTTSRSPTRSPTSSRLVPRLCGCLRP